MRIINYILLASGIILLLTTCERTWDNPYDPDCPKSIFTPKGLAAEIVESGVKLDWVPTSTHIDGFVIDRRASGGSWETNIAGTLNKSKTTYTDTNSQPGTTYDYRIFAVAGDNKSSEVMRENVVVPEGGGGMSDGYFTDFRDGNTYKTVEIGTQTWMAENLKYLPSVSPPTSESHTSPYYYVYNYEETSVSSAKATNNYDEYGVLYNWPAATNACPSGWHLPSDYEWEQMEMAIGMSQSEVDATGSRGTDEGTKLKATSGWYNNGNGTDDYGFGALPGGYRNYNGSFDFAGSNGYWWSATGYGSSPAWYRYLSYYGSDVYRNFNYREYGFSVRCVRD